MCVCICIGRSGVCMTSHVCGFARERVAHFGSEVCWR